MLPISLARPNGRPLRVLCLGAHCDDIEIGCGGALLRLIEAFPGATYHWIVLSSNAERRQEALTSAAAFLDGVPEARREIAVEAFRESYFPWVGAEIKDYFFERLAACICPDVIFTHARDDRHQDHRVVSDLTWNTFRNHLILEYEVPKYDGDLGIPNLYVALDEATAQRKVELLIEHFPSQRSRRWFDVDTFRGLMRLRGVEANAPERFAEGFYCRKAVL
jgi:LmbE family N-acetylglucosaminyl deacetylase